MKTESEQELLTRYSRGGDESAFAEIVRRQVDWVYSAARRIVVDPHLAEDVTQSVFTALARDSTDVARRLGEGVPLSAWLHRTTRNLAAKLVRTEERRRTRENAVAMNPNPHESAASAEPSWDDLAPHLDAAIAELPDPDRDALILRYFERQTSREIGGRLGIAEEAAQKRVSRAMERLRSLLAARGLPIPVASLATAVGTHAVQSAPAGLAATIGAVAVATSEEGAAGMMAWLSPKAVAVGSAVIAAGLAVTVVSQLQQRRDLESQIRQLAASVEVQRVDNGSPPSPPRDDRAELLRLRGDVARLTRERDALKAAAVRPVPASPTTAAMAAAAAAQDLEAFRNAGIQKLNDSKQWALACILYSQEHGDQLPDTLSAAATHLEASNDGPQSGPDDYEVMFRGSLAEVSNPASAILFRERKPFPNFDRPGVSRTYGFVDGHSEIRRAEDGNFDAYEAERTAVLRTPVSGAGSAPP